MQYKIRILKDRIEKNHSKLISVYGDKCELAMPVLKMIDILIKIDAADDIIKNYLDEIDDSLLIIEEKLQYVENDK